MIWSAGVGARRELALYLHCPPECVGARGGPTHATRTRVHGVVLHADGDRRAGTRCSAVPQGWDAATSVPRVGRHSRCLTLLPALRAPVATAGDEPGIKEVLSCKGHAGAKPCVMCQNCVLHTHIGAAPGCGLHQHDDWLVSIAETDVMKFVLLTYGASIARVASRSDRGRNRERCSRGHVPM